MLEKIVKVVNDFQENFDAENAKLKTEITRIQKTYKETSQDYLDMKMAARNAFNEKIENARVGAIEAIHNCAGQNRTTLADVTSKPAPADAVATIELLKAGNPEATSEFEVKSILEKYKENYLATKMIAQITGAEKRFGIMCMAADQIVSEINEIEEMACSFVNQYNGNMTFSQALLLQGEIVMSVDAKVQGFINHKYCEDVAEAMSV